MLGAEWRFGASAHLSDFEPLLPAEEAVVAGLPNGDFDRLGDGARPVSESDDRVIRAHFLRFLLLGGDEDCRPHEKGIRLSGAWIAGHLDLESCRIVRDIGLNNCRFETAPNLNSAVIERLFLDGSSLPGLHAERLEARGGLYLRGADVDGEVRLISATLGGNVECDGADFRPGSGPAINAEGIEARRLQLRGARCGGRVILTGAELVADLDCAGMMLAVPGGVGIDAGAIDVGGSIVLRSAAIDGEVRLLAARVGGDLDCSGARIANPGQAGLQLSRATIAGAFFLRDGAVIDGALAMTGATIGSILDEAASWPRKGDLLLNRCLYNAFIGGPVDAASRLDWLSRQSPERWGEDFWPQPYEQLASVLQEMGHEEDARAVLIAKEGLQREARRKRTRNPLWRLVLTCMDGVLKVTVGYGRQPFLAFIWLLLFWAIGVAVFSYAESVGAIRPTSPVVLRQPEWTLCGVEKTAQRELAATGQMASGRAEPGQNQLACFRSQWEAASFPIFSPWMYSLDNLLPVLDLEQKSVWSPDPAKPFGWVARLYFYLQAILGWTLSLLAVAGFSGLVRIR
jgi:hypothetical protein